jgi:hypothetical protein
MILVIVGGFGWVTWYMGEPQPRQADGGEELLAKVDGEEELLVKLIERHIHLAKGQTPENRFQVLVDMAADLRIESLRLANVDAELELPALVDLYTRVVQEGLVARAKQVPADQVKALRVELRRTQIDAGQAAIGAPPNVAAVLRQLADSARTAEEQLNALGEATP